MTTPFKRPPRKSRASRLSAVDFGSFGFGYGDPQDAGVATSRPAAPSGPPARAAKIAIPEVLAPRAGSPTAARSEGALPSLAAPALSRAEALFDECARVDPLRRLARISPFGDEACAALFGLQRWVEYLRRSGSGVLHAPGGLGPDGLLRRDGLLFDLAPQAPSARFDPRVCGLIADRPVPRPSPPRRLVEAYLARGHATGEVAAALLAAASSELRPGLRLWPQLAGGAPRHGLAWSLAATGPCDLDAGPDLGFDPVAAVLRLGVAADLSNEVSARVAGQRIAEVDLGPELWSRTLETMMILRSSALAFDNAISALPFFGIVEGPSLRLMTFAGTALCSLALLVEARVAGDVVPTTFDDLASGSDRASVLAPRPRGLQEGVEGCAPFDAAWFERAFEAVRRFVPCVPIANDVREGSPYRAADLAEGLEYARMFAFASVALAAEHHRVDGATGDRDAHDELAFWRAGVAGDGPLGPASHGLAPLMLEGDVEWRLLEREPAGLVAALRAGRRAAGLDESLTAVAAALRAKVTDPEDLGVFVIRMPRALEAQVTSTAFERKVARTRRLLAERLAAREAQGLEGLGLEPKPVVIPAGWPDFQWPRQEELLQLVPQADCQPRLGPHPAPLAAYQLEEPQFIIDARARREAAKAADRQAASAAREDLGDLIACHEEETQARDGSIAPPRHQSINLM